MTGDLVTGDLVTGDLVTGDDAAGRAGVLSIRKRFRFEAAHHLPDLAPGHKCARPHGHSYTVEITVSTDGDLTGPGFVVDFAELSPLGRHLQQVFDHRDLNDVLPMPPTSEHLAVALYRWCVDRLTLPRGVWIDGVEVSETDSTSARFAPARRPV